MDIHSREQRSFNMSKIQGKNTKPEMLVRKLLWKNGYRYRLHYKGLPGKPDIVFPGRKKLIFVNGCFWHRHDCRYFVWPKTNPEFWRQKIDNNFHRDQKNLAALIASGWGCLIIWECTFLNVKQSDWEDRLQQVGKSVEQFLIAENYQSMEIDTNGLRDLNLLLEESDE